MTLSLKALSLGAKILFFKAAILLPLAVLFFLHSSAQSAGNLAHQPAVAVSPPVKITADLAKKPSPVSAPVEIATLASVDLHGTKSSADSEKIALALSGEGANAGEKTVSATIASTSNRADKSTSKTQGKTERKSTRKSESGTSKIADKPAEKLNTDGTTAIGGGAALPININAASPTQLATVVKGIGPSKAEAIVRYREMHGAFASLEALANVKGIGLKTVEKLRDYLFVGDIKIPAAGESIAEQEADAREAVQSVLKNSKRTSKVSKKR